VHEVVQHLDLAPRHRDGVLAILLLLGVDVEAAQLDLFGLEHEAAVDLRPLGAPARLNDQALDGDLELPLVVNAGIDHDEAVLGEGTPRQGRLESAKVEVTVLVLLGRVLDVEPFGVFRAFGLLRRRQAAPRARDIGPHYRGSASPRTVIAITRGLRGGSRGL